MRTHGPSPFRGKQGPNDFPLLSGHIAGVLLLLVQQ